MQALTSVLQHGGGAAGARLGDPSEHARRGRLGMLVDAGVDALGGERDEHVLAGVQPALGERLHEQLARAADVRRRGEHDRLPGTGVAHDRRTCPPQRTRVGRAPLVDRRGHADHHEIGRVERLAAVGQHEAVAFEVAAQAVTLGIEQLGLTAADLRQTLGRAVEADDPAAGVAQCDRGGKPDVAEPDDGDHGVLACDGGRGVERGGAHPERVRRLDLGPQPLDRRFGRDVSQHGDSPLSNR